MKEYVDYIITTRSGNYLFSSYDDNVVALVSNNDIQYCHIFKSKEEAFLALENIKKAECFYCDDTIHKFANLKVVKLITKLSIEEI